MAIEVKLSSLGVNITEGTILSWLKKEGDRVEKGEILAEVETEKVNFEITAPESGVLLKLFYGENALVPVDSTVALIGEPGEDIAAYTVRKPEEKKVARKDASPTPQKEGLGGESVNAFPAAKMLAKQHGIELAEVEGTGSGGRVTKQDVEAFIARRQEKEGERIPELEELIPLVGIRKAIADGMSLSVRTAAHVTTIAEVDMTELVKLRSEIGPQWKEEGFNLTYVPFVIRAAVDGIRQFSIMNSQMLKDSIVVKKYVNFGVVVAIKEGLVTPVLKRVESKTVKDIARALDEISARARERKLSLDDMRGGTITLSNPGVFGAVIATPIIYQPQNAVLWMGRIAKMPVVRNDEIVIRSMMYLCVSYDHRAIDGSLAAQFLQYIRKLLEDPHKLL
jgi:pyruvate/2-oxoglutarate dehydrogenase complex dihydrolipoamide acyltransferase (E2) component